MAKRGLFRRIADKVTAPVKKVAETVAAPFKKSPDKPRRPKRSERKKAEKVALAPPKRPSPAVAREQLHAKLQDMYWLQKKWDAAAMSKRIDKMTDDQVYRALEMSENDVESAVRTKPDRSPEWASPDDPNSNILWYHGGDVTV